MPGQHDRGYKALFLVETSDVAELHAHFGENVPQWVDDTRTLQEVPIIAKNRNVQAKECVYVFDIPT